MPDYYSNNGTIVLLKTEDQLHLNLLVTAIVKIFLIRKPNCEFHTT